MLLKINKEANKLEQREKLYLFKNLNFQSQPVALA
jgi:hypothetical protein